MNEFIPSITKAGSSDKRIKTTSKNKKKNRQQSPFFKQLSRQRSLLFMCLPFVVLVFIFNYLPLWGWLMAFQNYKPHLGVRGSEWVGLKHFKDLFSDKSFWLVLRNTLAMSSLKLVFGFLSAIILAILLNELHVEWFKRTVQTISYLPYFISWVVAANLVMTALSSEGGIINELLMFLGIIDQPKLWLGTPRYFWWIIVFSDMWKNVGWNAIIYLSAMTSIDPELYEAANIDGAGRLKRIWHITLPGIRPVFTVLLIMNLGWILNAGFEHQLLLMNPIVREVAEVIDIFVLRYGINMGRYSFATAAGIFKSLVSIIMLVTADLIVQKLNGDEEVL
ncbi:MAG: Protein lplB [Xylanivirga thermophila]